MSVEVEYRFPAGVDAAKAAEKLAVGQSAGTWDARWAHRQAALTERLAKVVDVGRDERGRGTAVISFPAGNYENDVGGLLTMIFGKFSIGAAARVTAVRLPAGFGTGPRFGLAGLRERTGAHGRPIVMAIFKPALGLSADDHAAILREAASANGGRGLEIIKDDEILGDLPSAPLFERLAACRAVIDEVRRATGRTLLYALNVTGDARTLHERARRAVAEGANALLVNAVAYGWGALEALARDPAINVPLFVHPALAGALAEAPDHGIAYSVLLGTLAAHAGADAVLYPAHYGNLPFDPAEEARIRDALRARGVAAVPSAGIHPGSVPRTLADYGADVVLNAGTGIMDHPDGPGAGVTAFFEALDRAVPGVPFVAGDLPAGPLRRAIEKWGSR